MKVAAVAVVAIAIGLSACNSTPQASGKGTAASQVTLTMAAADGENWPCSFNPFNPNTYFFSLGMVNEELYYVDSISGKMTPWLATAYQWSNGDKTLTWTIRKGVKWSNGQPLTAADVAFTFNLIKKNPDLDLNSIDPLLQSVTQTGADTVQMNFTAPAVTVFYYIADQVSIVPQSAWKSVSNPLTYQDKQPIGTGPYTVGSCTPQNISYVKNPNYWQPGLPKIAKVEVPAILTNTVANEDLANGTAQWGGQYIPNIKTFYLARNPKNQDWSPPVGVNGIYVNMKAGLLSNVAVRQAIAYGIDRAKVTQFAEDGEVPVANQAGVLLPAQNAWYNSTLAATYNYGYDPAKAISILEKAGFKRGQGGIFQNAAGQKLAFTIMDTGAYSDQVAGDQIIVQEMAQIGIKLTQENLSGTTASADKADGKFDLAAGGPPQISVDGPYGILRGLLYSPNSAPIGKPASSDYERYSSPAEDALFNELSVTTDVTKQEQIVKQLEAPMLQEVPFIPIEDAVAQNEDNSGFATGWPSPANPYANPSPTTQPDEAVVLLHLIPVS
jgi:peptide/nickel transport system substrate-binding protein